MRVKLSLTLITALFFGGCSFTNHEANIPQMELPNFEQNSEVVISEKWWEDFGDKELNNFVEIAIKNSSSLEIASLRVSQFREFLNIKKAEEKFKIDLNGGVSHQKTSDYTPPQNRGFEFESYNLGFLSSFELDFFDKLKNKREVAREQLMQNIYLKETILKRLTSDVVIAYFGVKSHKKLYEIVKSQYEDRLKSYEYIKNRYENGFAEKSVLLQEESLLEMTKDELLAKKEALENYKTATSILLGIDVVTLFDEKNLDYSSEYNSTSLKVPANIPSDILNKRADIKMAEAKIKMSAFNVSVAKSAYFPTFNLTTSLGFVSGELDNFISSGGLNYSIGTNLLSPIVDFGKIEANIKVAKIEQKIAISEYKDTVRRAFGEIKDSVSKYATNMERLKTQEKRYKAIKEKKDIFSDKYMRGFVSHLEFLEVRKEEFGVAIQKEQTSFETIKSIVNLYHAFGAGFDGNKY